MPTTGGDVLLDHGHDGRVAYLTLSHGSYTIVIRSDGKHFTSGGDIAGFMEVEPFDLTDLGHDVTAAARSPKPVVVAVDGYCFGVGLELAVSCDIRLATERSEFALPEMNLGMIPGSGGTQRLARLIGLSRAKYHILTATRIQAQQALDWGLVAELHPDRAALDSATEALVAKLVAFSPSALRTGKEVLDRGTDGPLYTGIELERKAYAMLRATPDFAEGVKAFGEKRKPDFTGR